MRSGWRRLGTRGFAVLVLVLVLAACTPSSEDGPEESSGQNSGQSAWDLLTDRLGPEGQVSEELALDAFATLIGPIPGGNAQQAPSLGVTSGTIAVHWLTRHWDQLNADQREAAHTALSPSVAPAEEAAVSDLQQFVDQIAEDFRAKHREFDPLPARAGVLEQESFALAQPADEKFQPVVRGPVTNCLIKFDPVVAERLSAVLDLDPVERDPAAMAAFEALAAHELMHCHVYGKADSAERALSMPDWIGEGAAEWGGLLFAYPTSAAPDSLATGSWGRHFDFPYRDLYDRSYEAVGFWANAERPWSLLHFATSQSWELSDGPQTRVLAAAREERSGRAMAQWAMSYLRRPDLGTRWETSGPGLGQQRSDPPELLTLPVDDEGVLPGAPRGVRFLELSIASEVDVLALDPQAEGAVHWGDDQLGPDDLFRVEDPRLWFCLDPEGCPCPEGMVRKFWVPMVDRPFPTAVLTFFGSPDDPQVSWKTLSMESATETLCKEEPVEKDPEIEFTVCDTWLPRDELLGLVPGADIVTPGFNDTGKDEAGNVVVSCSWSWVGNPQDAEPWFDWKVDLLFVFVLRADEPRDDFAQRIADVRGSIGCDLVSLPGGLTACERVDGSEGILLHVQISPDAYLGLSASDLDYQTVTGRDFVEVARKATAVLSGRLD